MQPLAERLRPKTLDEYIGQKHLVGPGAILRKMIDAGRISSFILWGPPGVGKTTLAQIIANKLETPFYTLSAVTSGVKDVREVIDRAKSNRFFSQSSPILFIDEIHRFSKSQQDSLLGAVENGTVTLIGATTENPSFEVIRPLLSRCKYVTITAKALGVEKPKVAMIAPTEQVLPKVQSTVDAAILSKMGERGQIPGCTIEGPMALDVAIDKEAAEIKKMQSVVAGDADCLIFPNLESGNVFYKTNTKLGHSKQGAVLVGAKVPSVLSSRGDSVETKLNSIALAAILSE